MTDARNARQSVRVLEPTTSPDVLHLVRLARYSVRVLLPVRAGVFASTLGDATMAAAGAVANPVTGTFASTLGDATMAATGDSQVSHVTGTFASTLGDATMAAAGNEHFTGDFASTLGDATMDAAGSERLSGTFASTLGDAVMDAAGAEAFTGTFASTLGDATMAAEGDVLNPVTGTFAATLQDATMAAAGDVDNPDTIVGTFAATLQDATMAAAGDVDNPVIEGTFASTLGAATMAAAGDVVNPEEPPPGPTPCDEFPGCQIEWPADSGRFYHRRPDGAVLRVEVLGEGWYDLTADVMEVSITWGDTSGDDLTPYPNAGQAQIHLEDADGRYGPLPPSGEPLWQRWRPVRVWLGYVADPDVLPDDLTTRYGWPGEYGSTPPETYGGTQRLQQAEGIACRFSGWLMSQERQVNDPDSEVTTWTCGDGMVRLVDQTVEDYDVKAKVDADWPRGLRENAAGNYRVEELIGFVHGPDGASYPVDSTPSPTRAMMQSPAGKVGALVKQVAESDLAFFWWQPDAANWDHDVVADWFGYRTFDWLAEHGLEWPVNCDGIQGFGATLVSDDRSFYSAVKAAKAITKRTTWWPQPPWSGFAFDSSVAKVIGSATFKVQPGEAYTFKVSMDPVVTKAGIEFWTRITGTDLYLLGDASFSKDPKLVTQVTSSSPRIELDPELAPDTVIEVQVRARAMSPVTAPGYLATNVWLIVERASGPGPEVLVDDPALADEAEIHEYERKSLLLRQQPDVDLWASWIVNRSSVNRWTLETVSEDPHRGDPDFSWGAWHSAWLGDRVLLTIPDGPDQEEPTNVHEEVMWIRGLEFRVTTAEVLLAFHLETLPAPTFEMLDEFSSFDVRSFPADDTTPSMPIPGGRIIPTYESRPELPGWSYQNTGHRLIVSPTGELSWGPGGGGIEWPIQTAEPPLFHGYDLAQQNHYPMAFIQLDRMPDSVPPGSFLPQVIQFHPLSEYGPLLTNHSGGTGTRDVNPDASFGQIHTDWGGGIALVPAEFLWYMTSAGDDEGALGTDDYLSWETARDVNLDVVWSFDFIDGGTGGGWEEEHYADLVRHYDSPQTGDQAWDGGSAEMDLGYLGFFQLFSEAWTESREKNHYTIGGMWSRAPTLDRLGSYDDTVNTAIWAERIFDHSDDAVYEQFEVHFNTRSIRVYDGPHGVSLPDGLLCRGNVSVLAAVADVHETDDDPRRAQWYRQIGVEDVTFTAGVGTITVPAEMGDARHPQATVVGTTVGGDRVAQVDTTATTLVVSLDSTFSGTLSVSWSVEYEEPDWSATQPVAGYINVLGWGTYGKGYFLHDNTVVIPYDVGAVDIELIVHGANFDAGSLVCDSTGTPRGTVTSVWDVPVGQDRIYWTIQSDWSLPEEGDIFHVLNPDGQRSNIWRMVWTDGIPLPGDPWP